MSSVMIYQYENGVEKCIDIEINKAVSLCALMLTVCVCVPSLSTVLSLPKCGKGKPALVRRNTVDDKSELIACIENGNFAKAARIAAGKRVE